ncbi:MAG: hypothetical protein ACTSYS_13895 [Promethearchaeota archaeon]
MTRYGMTYDDNDDEDKEKIEIIVFLDANKNVLFLTISPFLNEIEKLLRALHVNYTTQVTNMLITGDGDMLSKLVTRLSE